jgi:hypothetical protein
LIGFAWAWTFSSIGGLFLVMERIEEEAKARRCEQIVLGTHDFQAPDFYRKLGFKLTGTIEEYPRGDQLFTFV